MFLILFFVFSRQHIAIYSSSKTCWLLDRVLGYCCACQMFLLMFSEGDVLKAVLRLQSGRKCCCIFLSEAGIAWLSVWFQSSVLYQSGLLLLSFTNDTCSTSVVTFITAKSLFHLPVPNKPGNRAIKLMRCWWQPRFPCLCFIFCIEQPEF